MDLTSVSIKHINELEQQTTNMLKALRTAKLQEQPAYESLQKFEQALSEARREHFDDKNSEYQGF